MTSKRSAEECSSRRAGPSTVEVPLRPLRGSLWLAVLSGAAWALAYPPLHLWPLIFLAWVPLWVAVDREAHGLDRTHRGRRVFLHGWLMGAVAFAGMLHWILALSNEEVTIPGLMIPALALIAFYLGLFCGLAALLALALAKWSRWPFLILAPVVAVLFEWLRALGPLGFPWGTAPYALARIPPLLQTASALGFWGLTAVILATNALLAAALRGRRWALPAALGVIAALWIHGTVVLACHPADRAEQGRHPVRVLVAQPDIRREIKWKPEKRDEVIRLVMEHGYAAVREGRAAGGYDLFVWPETVLPVGVLQDDGIRADVAAFVDSGGAPVLLGTQESYWRRLPVGQEWVAHNSAVLLYPGGMRSEMYRKMRLVPFSERMPLQHIVPFLRYVDFGQSNFYPGTAPVLFELGRERVGTLICFESVFPEVSRAFVRRGATLLVNITNDFWFGRTAGPGQHAEMAVLRAVENRVPIVRCANTGISCTIDPWGRIAHETEIFTPAAFVATVQAGAGSFAAGHPDWIAWPLLGTLAAALAAGASRRLGGRRLPSMRDPGERA